MGRIVWFANAYKKMNIVVLIEYKALFLEWLYFLSQSEGLSEKL